MAWNNSEEETEWISGELLAEREETEWRQLQKVRFDGNTIWSSKTFSPEKRIWYNKWWQILSAIVELKRQGFGRVDHHSPISKEDLEKIQSSYNPSSPDPRSLQQVVWFNIMFHLIRRGRENLRLLTKESFAMQVDAAGKISKELKLSQKYTNHCIRATAVLLLDECNFEARHIMCVSGHKSDSRIRSYSRRLSEVKRKKSPMLSLVPLLLKILSQLALQLWRCMSRQVKVPLVEAQCQTPLWPCKISHLIARKHFQEQMFLSIFTIPNDFVFVIEVIKGLKAYFTFSCTSKHL